MVILTFDHSLNSECSTPTQQLVREHFLTKTLMVKTPD